jgi:hypothetical protein
MCSGEYICYFGIEEQRLKISGGGITPSPFLPPQLKEKINEAIGGCFIKSMISNIIVTSNFRQKGRVKKICTTKNERMKIETKNRKKIRRQPLSVRALAHRQ